MSNIKKNLHRCFVPKCKNTDKSSPGKIFITVPKDIKKRKKWWLAAHREFPVLQYSLYCCEDHFNLREDMENYLQYTMMGGYIKLKESVIPHKFECQGRSTPVRASSEVLKRKRLIREILRDKENIPNITATNVQLIPYDVKNTQDETEEPVTKEIGLQTIMVETRFQVPCINPHKRSKGVQVTWMRADAACNTDITKVPTTDIVSSSDGSDVDNDFSKDYIIVPSESASSSDDGDVAKKISINRTRQIIMKNPIGYIGLQNNHLYILDLICKHVSHNNRGQILSTRDEVMLCLMVIRTRMPNYIIADMFGITKSCVSRIFARVVPVMAGCLGELIFWPPSDVIRRRLPHSFKAYYHKVESIIDCFEIQIEKPSLAMTQSMTWSEYKKCNSVKYLISVTPAGLITFISCGRPGRCSDMELLRCSGYLDCLKPGVTVLADRGFKEVETDLAAKECYLARPASVSKNEKLPATEVLNMKVIAGLRIHVERVIRRVRVYRILDMHSCISLSMMDLLDDIVKIVCGLVNLQERIVKV